MLPVCGLPEALFGEPITNLDPNGLDWCMEPIYNNPHDAASSTYGVFMANGKIKFNKQMYEKATKKIERKTCKN